MKLSLASTLERERKYGDAEAIFRQMIADDPKNADALNSLGYMFAERGQKLDEAVALVQRALAIEPGNGAYLDSLGWAYYKQNRLELAEAPLRRSRRAAADGVGDSGSSRRPAEQARLVRGSDRRLAESARRRWRLHLPLGRWTTRSNRRARNLAEKSKLAFSILLLTIGLAACGQPRVTLPGGTGTPAPDFAPAYAQARAACDSVRTMQAELGLSGRAAGQRMRGRVLAGLVPGALRLEGVAPFGAPVFILVADGARGTLLLLARAPGRAGCARRRRF